MDGWKGKKGTFYCCKKGVEQDDKRLDGTGDIDLDGGGHKFHTRGSTHKILNRCSERAAANEGVGRVGGICRWERKKRAQPFG